MNSLNAQARNTPERVERFRIELTKLLMATEGKGRFYNELSVDYGPNELLRLACELSGIDSGCLPCKTFTCINNNNRIEGRYQYGGEFFEI